MAKLGRLADLNPWITGKVAKGVLVFDCPSGSPHKIRVHIRAESAGEDNGVRWWQASGEFPDSLTLQPSINEQHINPDTGQVEYQCWHGFIINGEVTSV